MHNIQIEWWNFVKKHSTCDINRDNYKILGIIQKKKKRKKKGSQIRQKRINIDYAERIKHIRKIYQLAKKVY